MNAFTVLGLADWPVLTGVLSLVLALIYSVLFLFDQWRRN